MSDGFLVPPGAGEPITLGPMQVRAKVTGDHAVSASTFEVVVPPGFDVGAVSVQDCGAQLATLLLDAQPGMRVLDACAAPGGKTSMLRGNVTAVEVHPGRAQALAASMGPNVHVVNADVRELDESGFDRALVDAPCSGLGVLARIRGTASTVSGNSSPITRARGPTTSYSPTASAGTRNSS